MTFFVRFLINVFTHMVVHRYGLCCVYLDMVFVKRRMDILGICRVDLERFLKTLNLNYYNIYAREIKNKTNKIFQKN